MPERPPSLRIDLHSPEPAYRQISAQLRTLIVEGRLAPGDLLPPVRRLALELAVHFNTVAEAYRQLAEEGWLEVSHGKAARVAERRADKRPAAEVESLRQRLRNLVAEMKAAGISGEQIGRDLKSHLEE